MNEIQATKHTDECIKKARQLCGITHSRICARCIHYNFGPGYCTLLFAYLNKGVSGYYSKWDSKVLKDEVCSNFVGFRNSDPTLDEFLFVTRRK